MRIRVASQAGQIRIPSAQRWSSTDPTPSEPQPWEPQSTEVEEAIRDDKHEIKVAETKEEAEAEEEDERTATPADDGDVPWYLQVEPPRHAKSMQDVTLPEPPKGSPAVLGPLIQYVFEEMGLDDISLLDLRSLEATPAFGPNLIMLFGTARTERHLHISTRAFTRWLRKNHDVNATAAGLLTPAEIKVKLRRMRKKSRQIGSVGYDGSTGSDDGISTGWICINLGTVGSRKGETVSTDAQGRMAGFGQTKSGTTIVVQAMTEARRQDMDLEKLWTQTLDRNTRLLERMDQELAGMRPRSEGWSGPRKGGERRPQQSRGFATVAPLSSVDSRPYSTLRDNHDRE